MEKIIRVCDLPCYEKADLTKGTLAYKNRKRCFNLEKLPTVGLQNEFASFIWHRGETITFLSMRSDLTQYNIVSGFLSERYPDLESLLNVEEVALEKEMRKWLMKNGKPVSTRKTSKRLDNEKYNENVNILYLRKVYRFLQPEDTRPEREKDIWRLDRLGLTLTLNPILNAETINFTRIGQAVIRKEVKDAMYMHLQTRALGTVQAEITAINRFSLFLMENYEDVESLAQVDREILESYLIYLNTELNSRKSYRSDLFHLKSVLDIVGRMTDNPAISNLFLVSDIPKQPEKIYRSYSDAELIRWNSAIVSADVQVARALILHQMLGTRISDTLTLKQDCVFEKNGKYLIRIYQIKSRRQYKKTINEDILSLINAAIAYTQAHSPDSPYIFANEKNPDRPMTYCKIQYQLTAIIVENDLRDDNGNLFGVGTHVFRHTYGKKLTDMHIDDITIAKLLGHANTSSVKYYRKMSNSQMKEETQEMMQSMDDILKKITKGW